MLLHVRLLVKSLAAIITRERPDVGVDQHVSGQGRGAFEMFAARLALEYLNSGMRLPVLREAHVMTESLSARDAAVWAAPRVRASHVHLQTVRRAKYFLTGVARVCLVTVGLLQLVFMLRFHALLKMHFLAIEGHIHVSYACRRFTFRKIIAF